MAPNGCITLCSSSAARVGIFLTFPRFMGLRVLKKYAADSKAACFIDWQVALGNVGQAAVNIHTG